MPKLVSQKPKRLFQRKKVDTQIVGQYPGITGYYEPINLTAVRTVFRAKVPPIKKWKYAGERAGATFFTLPNGKKIVVKPVFEPFHFNTVGVNNGIRDYSKVLERVIRKKIRFEVPLGRIRTSKGKWYYVTKAVEGRNMEDWIKSATMIEGIKVAQNMGKYLADMHRKGVNHLETSPHNWIINGTKATLVDTKYITFKEEYPHMVQSGNEKTWENSIDQSARTTANWLPKKIQPFFWESYKN